MDRECGAVPEGDPAPRREDKSGLSPDALPRKDSRRRRTRRAEGVMTDSRVLAIADKIWSLLAEGDLMRFILLSSEPGEVPGELACSFCVPADCCVT